MNEAFFYLIQEIEDKRNEIKCSKTGAFFRGHSNYKYKLIPSLFRNYISRDTEHNLYHEFFVRAGTAMDKSTNSWERLAFLQHYGIPTRFLDWTESLGVALFFALNGDIEQPHIWIMNGFLLNKASTKNNIKRIFTMGLDPLPDYHDCFIKLEDKSLWPYENPIFMQVPWSTERIKAQKGLFTFHIDATPLDEIFPNNTRKINISNDAIDGIHKFLNIAGINEYSVFPDFVGLASFLRQKLLSD